MLPYLSLYIPSLHVSYNDGNFKVTFFSDSLKEEVDELKSEIANLTDQVRREKESCKDQGQKIVNLLISQAELNEKLRRCPDPKHFENLTVTLARLEEQLNVCHSDDIFDNLSIRNAKLEEQVTACHDKFNLITSLMPAQERNNVDEDTSKCDKDSACYYTKLAGKFLSWFFNSGKKDDTKSNV